MGKHVTMTKRHIKYSNIQHMALFTSLYFQYQLSQMALEIT